MHNKVLKCENHLVKESYEQTISNAYKFYVHITAELQKQFHLGIQLTASKFQAQFPSVPPPVAEHGIICFCMHMKSTKAP